MDVGAIKGLLDLVKLGRKALKRMGAFLCRAELARMKRELEAVEDRAEKAEREVRRIQLESLEKTDKLAALEREADRRAGFALVSVDGIHAVYAAKSDGGDPPEGRRVVCPRCFDAGRLSDLSSEVRVHRGHAPRQKFVRFSCADPACVYRFTASVGAVKEALDLADQLGPRLHLVFSMDFRSLSDIAVAASASEYATIAA